MTRLRLTVEPAATCSFCGCQFIWQARWGPRNAGLFAYLGCPRDVPVSQAIHTAGMLAAQYPAGSLA